MFAPARFTSLTCRRAITSSICIQSSFSQIVTRPINQPTHQSYHLSSVSSYLRSFHSTSSVSAQNTRPPYNSKQPLNQSNQASKQSNQLSDQPIDVSKLPLIYSYDRSKTWRLITIGSAVLLVAVWTPLTYLSFTTDVLPAWQTALGPLTAVAMIVATHYKARRTISALHYLDSNRFVVTVHNALGQPRSFPMKFIDSKLAVQPQSKTSKVDSALWILQLQGHSQFFVLDKQGKITDLNSMRRLVGDDDVFHNQ